MNFDYLPYIDLPYKQPEDAYHFNTDTVLLGLFLPDLNNRKILDIGTNCGALLCYAAKKNASMLYGLDLNKEALEYADINLKQCGAKFSLFHQNFKDFAIFELDAVVVNPPFYPDKERDSVSENLAMNSSNMPSVELFSKCRSILKDNGSIYSIYPADRLNSYIEAEMSEYEEQLKQMAQEAKDAAEAKTITDADARKIKEIYYRLARKIHPDMRPEYADDKQIMDYWNRIVIAYQNN